MNPTFRWIRQPLAPVIVIAIAVIVLLSYWTSRADRPAAQPAQAPPTTAVLQASERVPSATADDWASVADVVVLAHVTEERRLEPPSSETSTGDGENLIGRDVSVEIDDVVWHSSEAAQLPAGTLTLDVAGWLSDEKSRRDVVLGQGPRIEPGHQYVMALVKVRAECDENDSTTPTGWSTIGSGGVLPADDGRVGRGEYLGSVTEGLRVEDVPASSVLAKTLGGTSADVTELIGKSEVKRINFQANATPCN